jgi:hypothetical protein
MPQRGSSPANLGFPADSWWSEWRDRKDGDTAPWFLDARARAAFESQAGSLPHPANGSRTRGAVNADESV